VNDDFGASDTRLSLLIVRGGTSVYSGVPLSEMAIARGTRPETRSAGHFPGPSDVKKTSRSHVARFWVERAFRRLKKLEAKRFGAVHLFLWQSAYGDTMVDRRSDSASDCDRLA